MSSSSDPFWAHDLLSAPTHFAASAPCLILLGVEQEFRFFKRRCIRHDTLARE